MEKIKVSGKVKEYMIVNEKDEELGVIRINVTDFDFFNRTKEAEKQIMSIMNRFKGLHGKNLETEEIFASISELDKEIKEQLNYMFDYDVSSVVFGNTNCLSIGDGQPFVTRFLQSIIPAIKRDIEKENRQSKQKMSKYTKRYHK